MSDEKPETVFIAREGQGYVIINRGMSTQMSLTREELKRIFLGAGIILFYHLNKAELSVFEGFKKSDIDEFSKIEGN